MKKITAIIIDDEINARENLRYLLNTFCENVSIVKEVTNVDDGIYQIQKHKPQLVFLDIEMPKKNGFQLINYFKDINFYIIFITAYDQYAIKAFKYSALDYLLKPININQLKNAVKKVSVQLKKDNQLKKLAVLKENQKQISKIAIPYKSDYVIININDIICIEADRMYAHIKLINGKTYTASKKLSYYENLLSNLENFIRIHRSWIVNTNHIYLYSKKEKHITLNNNFQIPVSKSYKNSFESIFKSY